MSINVIKRDGSVEELDTSKITDRIIKACKGLKYVSPSEIEINTHAEFYDGMTTAEIDEALLRTIDSLITVDAPEYAFVGGRIAASIIRKEVYGSDKPWHLKDIIKRNVEIGVYDKCLIEAYSDEELEELNSYIDHSRDDSYTLAGASVFRFRYLVRNRKTGQLFESIQVAYMATAMAIYSVEENRENRLQYIKDHYDLNTVLNLPTPIMGGARTPTKQLSSCVLANCGDDMDSIDATNAVVRNYAGLRAGIGLNIGRMRGEGQPIRGGEAVHTGVYRFIQDFQGVINAISQGGIRKGSMDVNYMVWHLEFERLIELRNEKGTPEDRALYLDYVVHWNRYLLKRALTGQSIFLFSPEEVPDLYDAFYTPNGEAEFQRLYEQYIEDPKVTKKELPGMDVLLKCVDERKEVGRIYVFFADNVNNHSAFTINVEQTNLCFPGDTEVLLDDGSYKTIEELTNEYDSTGSEFSVFSAAKEKLVIDGSDRGEYWRSELRNSFAFYTQTLPVLKVTLSNGQWFECSPEHPLALADSCSYVPAKDSVGMELSIFSNMDFARITVVSAELTGETKVMYDLHVHENHNFYIKAKGESDGEVNVLVSNCTEILEPNKPLKHKYDAEGRIALCTLGAVDVLATCDNEALLEKACRTQVRFLDTLLDYQDYPLPAAEEYVKDFRSLGIGLTNVAAFFASKGEPYGSKRSLELLDEYMEKFSYYLIRASCDLAKEKGACRRNDLTKYGNGILPIDTYEKNVDLLIQREHVMPWEELRADLLTYGIRNAPLMAIMPAETSAMAAPGETKTSGFEPVNDLIYSKGLDKNTYKVAVPGIRKFGKHYTKSTELTDNIGYLKCAAVAIKWIDQGGSFNTYYNHKLAKGGKVSQHKLTEENFIFPATFGIPTMYYCNTFDDSKDANDVKEPVCESCSI